VRFIYSNSQMGAEITIDKHTTPIDDWLDIQDRLENINY
jgi:hypothetical protein